MSRIVPAVIVGMALAGCSKESGPEVMPIEDAVTYVDGSDATMNEAIKKARSTVPSFISALNTPKPWLSAFSVKVPVQDTHGVEHFWTSGVTYDGTRFHGTIDNAPMKVKSVKMGDTISIEPTKISDWMYIEHGKLVGGTTFRVLRDRKPEAERVRFDKSLPFKID